MYLYSIPFISHRQNSAPPHPGGRAPRLVGVVAVVPRSALPALALQALPVLLQVGLQVQDGEPMDFHDLLNALGRGPLCPLHHPYGTYERYYSVDAHSRADRVFSAAGQVCQLDKSCMGAFSFFCRLRRMNRENRSAHAIEDWPRCPQAGGGAAGDRRPPSAP